MEMTGKFNIHISNMLMQYLEIYFTSYPVTLFGENQTKHGISPITIQLIKTF